MFGRRKQHDDSEVEEKRGEKDWISDSVLIITNGIVIIVLALLLVFGF